MVDANLQGGIRLNRDILNTILSNYGDSFYTLDQDKFISNYNSLLGAFRDYYPNTHIAYSYKTNYIPLLCDRINDLGGYAEVVSEMELWLANKVGVLPEHVYYNGPYKKREVLENALLAGVHINADSFRDLKLLAEIAAKYPEKKFSIGIRCNFDIGDTYISRFGMDATSNEFYEWIAKINVTDNIRIGGFHCHFPNRSLESYKARIREMSKILSKINYIPQYVSFGGGYYGNIDESFKCLMGNSYIPTYKDYAEVIAKEFAKLFDPLQGESPELIIEPGSALVADTMEYCFRIIEIKEIRGQYIAVSSGSSYNVNPSVKNVKRPLERYALGENSISYDNINIAGYTCIEDDYVYRGYSGELAIGDVICMKNVGSYSVVFKPPFILPNVPIISLEDDNRICVIRDTEQCNHIFAGFDIKHLDKEDIY